MAKSAGELLDAVHEALAPMANDNRLVELIAKGAAPRSVFRLIAAEEHRIVPSDWRSFLQLAARSDEYGASDFFAGLAQGAATALGKLAALNDAVGLDDKALRGYQPLAGC